MNAQGWQDWLNDWLRRHPMKEPPEELRRGYVQQVMARIRAEQSPSPVVWKPYRQPAWRLAFGGALAAAMAVAVVVARVPERQAREIEEEAQVLLEADDGEPILTDEELGEELQLLDEEELTLS